MFIGLFLKSPFLCADTHTLGASLSRGCREGLRVVRGKRGCKVSSLRLAPLLSPRAECSVVFGFVYAKHPERLALAGRWRRMATTLHRTHSPIVSSPVGCNCKPDCLLSEQVFFLLHAGLGLLSVVWSAGKEYRWLADNTSRVVEAQLAGQQGRAVKAASAKGGGTRRVCILMSAWVKGM